MSLRAKLVLGLVALAAFATVAIGVSSYVSIRDRLYGEVDDSLELAAVRLAALRFDGRAGGSGAGDRRQGLPLELADGFDRPRSFEQILVQVIDGNGTVRAAPATGALPVGDRELAVATATRPRSAFRRDVELDGEPYRLLTIARDEGRGAVMVARSLAETRRSLDAIRDRTAAAAVLVTLATGLAGWLVAHQLTRRLLALTLAAEQVASTSRLDVPILVGGRDEAGRLAGAFSRMLEALARSKDSQQRLVQDAGHELRTPLTSLRTNVAVLRRFEQLSPDDRARIIGDLDSETRELGHLVEEIVVLASGEPASTPTQAVRLGELAEQAAERVRRRSNQTVLVVADSSTIDGRPAALERAITNLLDNAVKFSDDQAEPIELTVENGRITVCDRGPGISSDDLPHVFDRFYRAVDARSRPGSGLGLAIVRDAAEAHGGTVFARPRAGGGVCVGFEVPLA